ncbi:hypothetical protein [Microbulbifer sp. ZKSA002]|uniref:hypothetical protein n=1 Tax=Microbulbifer sp. ZKSA002 TaxID=3243388 RepID=UPI00403A1E6F
MLLWALYFKKNHEEFTFLLAFISIPIQAIEISNFKSGLMCGINKDDMGWVCFAQEEIKITGQSSCISNGNEFKCTWYGYSNPQYSVLSVSENANMKKVTQDVSCSSEGVELYKYRFISVYSAGK